MSHVPAPLEAAALRLLLVQPTNEFTLGDFFDKG
jgi:hypothetical protein